MTNEFHPRAFDALIRKLRDKHGAQTGPEAPDLLEAFVFAYLLWEAEQADAERALKRIASAVVDFNELRVCLPEEIVGMVGVRYPRASERAALLKSGLHDVFLREHAVTFDGLKEKPKRTVRQYLESLESIPPFVAARMMVVGFRGHAAPLDERLLGRLIDAEVFDEGVALEAAISALERHVKAEDAAETHLLLILGCEEGGGVPKGRARSGKSAARSRPAPKAAGARKGARKD